MTDYYEELGLDRSASLQDLQKELAKQKSIWKNRRTKDPTGTADKKLVLINDAQKVFASQKTKSAYDRSLKQAKTPVQNPDPEAERAEQFAQWKNKAREYLNAGDDKFDLAFAAFEKARSFSDSRKEDADFCYLAAKVLSGAGRFNEALDYINKAIVQDDSDADFEREKALILFDTLRDSRSENWMSYEKRESYQKRACDSARIAIEKARKAGDRETEGEARGLLSYILYVELGQASKAEEEAKRAVELCNKPPRFARKVLDHITKKREEEKQKAEEEERQRKTEEEERRRKAEEEKRRAEAQKERERKSAEWRKLKKKVRFGGIAAFVALWLVVHLPVIYWNATGHFSWYNPYFFNLLLNIGIACLGASFAISSHSSFYSTVYKVPAIVFFASSWLSLFCGGPGVIAMYFDGIGVFLLMILVDWVVLSVSVAIGLRLRKNYEKSLGL